MVLVIIEIFFTDLFANTIHASDLSSLLTFANYVIHIRMKRKCFFSLQKNKTEKIAQKMRKKQEKTEIKMQERWLVIGMEWKKTEII